MSEDLYRRVMLERFGPLWVLESERAVVPPGVAQPAPRALRLVHDQPVTEREKGVVAS